ncbi:MULTISPECIES: ATP-binding protein [Methylococcus]|uniref:ATP-binding protein n=1 Tax=Methylococcus capsulatus TaxID=414 RepID=A0ABZ2F535_METCP|nr:MULTISPECIES: ATP-binding protein [Methylococcus]MDF9393399.1 ATP-binding protein [Methylococcus capsulatus]
MTPEKIDLLLAAVQRLAEAVERLAPPNLPPVDWTHKAYRWRGRECKSPLMPVRRLHDIGLRDLLCIDRQKSALVRNTRQFLHGLPSNNALLWGSKGTGKSSLVKALLHDYADSGLRLIEVEKTHLAELPDIIEYIHDRPERFILFFDDLSFECEEPGYKALKSALDGSTSVLSANLLIYVTSNRRHLLPEYMAENLEARPAGNEIHPGDSVEEKISLSERFGLWLSFHPFSQDDYLAMVEYWLTKLGASDLKSNWNDIRGEALRWALARGSRSGRVAWQFAREWSGRTALAPSPEVPAA